MTSARRFVLLVCGASVMLLVGCAGSAGQPHRAGPSSGQVSRVPPADSPLTSCVNPTPKAPPPLDAPIAQDFAGGRVVTPISLDGGTFRAVPAARDAVPRIGAALAFCNLLAGATANNFPVISVAGQHGMSFGLGTVTVADSVLKWGPREYIVGARQQTLRLQPYHARLAWLAVILPDQIWSCPAQPSGTTAARPADRPPLPGYQILAVDADTGAAGIVYSAKTYANCGFAGYQPAGVTPAAEFVSVPWRLLRRGPGPQSATITYYPRPCDQPILVRFDGTGQPAVFADRDNPAVVTVGLERLLTSCGPATPTPILLRSSTRATDLPAHLVHGPVGAQDVPSPA